MSSETETVPSNPWTKSASPWGKTSAPVQPCSLEDVMSEQLATELQNKEENILNQEIQLQEELKMSEAGAPDLSEPIREVGDSTLSSMATDRELTDAEFAAKLAEEEVVGKNNPNDELIAQMLQREFDKEYDAAVSKKEQKYNGNSKVSISFENYKRRNQGESQNGVDDEDDDDEFEEGPEFPTPTQWEHGTPTIGNRGYSGQGKNIVTKHDKNICGRRNAERLMEFPPDFGCGDGEGMDMRLPNQVYNKLKAHSQADNKKANKVHEKKDHSTAIKAVDEKTRILIFKMINSGFLTSVDGVVSEGKEAVIFKATGGMKDDVPLPTHVIIKVYKTSMSEFKNRLKYISGDFRLSKDVFKKFNPRKLMKIWAEKECLNLKKMRRHDILCPTVLNLKKHILAMTCIGGEKPAPKIRSIKLSPEDLQDAYNQTVDLIKLMYHKCNLVHADLSAYNLLWHEEKVWVIDVGQAVDRDNANSSTFLLRDCKNITGYFKQAGVHGVPNAEGLFNEVTNYSLQGEGKVFESQTERYVKEEYAFDYFFELSESSRLQRLDIDSSDDSNEDDEGEEGEGIESKDAEKTIDEGDEKNNDSNSPNAVTSSRDDGLLVVE